MPSVRKRDVDPDLDVDHEAIDDVEDAETTMGIPEAERKVRGFIEKDILSGPAAIELQGSVVLDLVRDGKTTDQSVKRWRYHLDGADRMARIVVDKSVEDAESPGRFGVVRYVLKCRALGVSQKFSLERPQPQTGAANGLGQNDFMGTAGEFSTQQMEHNQVLTMLLLKNSDRNDNFLRNLLNDAYKRIARYEEQHLATMNLMESLTSLKWIREDQQDEKRKSAERKDQFMKLAVPLGLSVLLGQQNGAALAGLMGGMAGGPPPGPLPNLQGPQGQDLGAPPPESAPGVAAILTHVEMLTGSIDEEQMMRIMNSDMFRQEQIVMLFQLNEAMKAYKAARGGAPAPAAAPPVQATYEPAPTAPRYAPPEVEDAEWTGGFQLAKT